VRAALSTLPADQRKVLEMAYFEGATQAQISAELQIPIGTVKTRTLAAMRKLRRALYRED
jgi:RNA polymerase sigma-70 factor (ECF subfamily)